MLNALSHSCCPNNSFKALHEMKEMKQIWNYCKIFDVHDNILTTRNRRVLYASTRWALGHAVILTFDPKNWSVHRCHEMHHRRKFGEIQSSNFQHIALTRPKMQFPASWPWNLNFWSQNVKCSSLSQNAPTLKVWRKYVKYFSRHCVNNVRDAQTDGCTHARTARKHNAANRNTLAEA